LHTKAKLTIRFLDPNLELEDLDEQAQRLIAELKQVDEVEAVDRIVDPNPPKGNKSIGGFLVGVLTAEVSGVNIQKLIGFLGDRLGGKPIEFSVEANGKKLTVKAHSRDELAAAIKAAQEFVTA
jgi:hypothetical protein